MVKSRKIFGKSEKIFCHDTCISSRKPVSEVFPTICHFKMADECAKRVQDHWVIPEKICTPPTDGVVF